MHSTRLCHKLFHTALKNNLHKKRIQCLSRFTADLLTINSGLSLTEIGNHLTSDTSLKHKIKAADYFVGNDKLASNIPNIYTALAQYYFAHYPKLVVHVDWSGACAPGYHVLEASIMAHGRSIPVYQEIHHGSVAETSKVHEGFLKQLYGVIPNQSAVTIVTDAGFHRHWFETVSLLGWDFIGRVYTRYQYRYEGESQWHSIKDIAFAKRGQALAHGAVRLGKTGQPLSGYLYTYREKLSGKPHAKNGYPTHEKSHSDYYRKGWVLVSSLNKPARKLVGFYKKRMQIEETFRDIKNEHYGLGLRRNGSTGAQRIRMLYFLGTLLRIILWWIGLATERCDKHRQYQANTVKSKRIVSLVSLGRKVMRHEPKTITWVLLNETIVQLRLNYEDFVDTGRLN